MVKYIWRMKQRCFITINRRIMRIKIIKFVVKALGYEWSGDNLNLPVWYVKEKKKKKDV